MILLAQAEYRRSWETLLTYKDLPCPTTGLLVIHLYVAGDRWGGGGIPCHYSHHALERNWELAVFSPSTDDDVREPKLT